VKRRYLRLLLPLALVAVVAGAGGTYWLLRRQHDQDIEARLARHSSIIWEHSQANSLPPELVMQVIRVESGAQDRAESAKGAKGLMQITSATLDEVRRQRRIGDGNLFDADYNVRVGTAYLRILLDRFGGDAYLAVAAYNMGPTKLAKARRENPNLSGVELVEKFAPSETVRYCRAILGERDLKLPAGEPASR
jgi:soluble lytic murein transglycosylase